MGVAGREVTVHRGVTVARRASQILLGRFTRVFAVCALGLAVVLPAQGIGFPLCYFRALFHLPCPGCGLSRSFSSIVHLRLGEALGYHPFGLIAFPLLLGVLVVSLMPRRAQGAITGWLDQRDATVRRSYLTAVWAFLVFGVARMAYLGLANGWPAHSG
jgi:hypothetical protein